MRGSSDVGVMLFWNLKSVKALITFLQLTHVDAPELFYGVKCNDLFK